MFLLNVKLTTIHFHSFFCSLCSNYLTDFLCICYTTVSCHYFYFKLLIAHFKMLTKMTYIYPFCALYFFL